MNLELQKALQSLQDFPETSGLDQLGVLNKTLPILIEMQNVLKERQLEKLNSMLSSEKYSESLIGLEGREKRNFYPL